LSARAFSFGDFRLLPEERTLLAAGRPVRISSRALDILTVLVDHAGELVSKDQLIARAWPDTRVEENNLRVHIGALRKLLGDSPAGVSNIATVPGRGYSFVAHVEQESVQPLLATVPPTLTMQPLPAPLTRMIGRAETLVLFLSRMRKQRLVTIIGPGGMGKTTVALAMAVRLRRSFEHHASFVDLSPLADPQLLPSALASVLGIPSRSENPLLGLLAFLRDKRMLIVLDSCEHLVEAAAAMVEALLKGAPGVRVLATSREPLGVEGESVERLAPLGIPESPADLSAAQALAFPAIQLFAERAAAGIDGFEFSDEDVPAAVEICQKLDGIPLAIELAAARVGLFGIPGLAARLNDRLAVLTRGRRTAPPRHKTLRATLDWSYGILSADEQVVLKRLAIFCGEFTLDSATAVASSAVVASADVPEFIATLVAKSLIVASLRDGVAWYRLLDTTRAYAREKLLESTDFHTAAKLHAETLCKSLQALRASPGTAVAAELTSTYKQMVDDVRTALRWCFSSDGDSESGVRLTAAAASLFIRLSLLDEYRGHVERVVKDSALMAAADGFTQMSLHLALGHLLLHMAATDSQLTSTFDRALQISEQLGLSAPRAEALTGAWIASTRCADYPRALEFAQRLRRDAATTGQMDELVYSRMMAIPLHYMGEFAAARHFIEQALAHPLRRAQAAYDYFFYIDLEVVMYATLARNCWLQGFADQARDAARRSLERAVSINNATGVCYSLVIAACPVAIWRGDLAEAHRFTSMLLEYSRQYSLDSWHSRVPFFERVLLSRSARSNEPFEAATLDTTALDTIQIDAIATLREGSVPAQALARVESGRVGWNAAEILRVSGEQVRRDRGPEAARTAEAAYLRSLDIARRQAALSWELRTATSLARLWRDQHRTPEARELLAGVHGRFTEGFQTADYARAGALLLEFAPDLLGH
jgi:predicted ATPase/DNA-binding winged helix-turn-helix (wHTH) protein